MSSIPTRCSELRADLIQRCMEPSHVKFLNAVIKSSRHAGDRLFPHTWEGHHLAEDIQHTATMAEMWTVTPEMLDLMGHAAKSLPPQVLRQENLPSQQGFLYLPVPYYVTDIRGDRVPVRAILWTEREVGRPGVGPGGGVPKGVSRGVVFYLFMVNGENDDPAMKAIPKETLDRLWRSTPNLSLFHSFSVAFGHKVWDVDTSDVKGTPDQKAEYGRRALKSVHDGEAVSRLEDGRWEVRTSDGNIVRAIADPTIQFLHTYFHFAGSTLSSLEKEWPSKPTVKWLRRIGLPNSPITTIRLRRRESTGKGMGGWTLDYRHVRRGHWRAQWYGSGPDRYQQYIYIAPTIVGPEDGPLRVRDVVNLVQY